MKNFLERALLIQERINELQMDSLPPFFGSEAFKERMNKIAAWMREAGLETRIDNIGNVRGKLVSENPDAKIFVMGSHFDHAAGPEKNGGILGILAGIDLAENFRQQKTELPFHLELIAFAEAEGFRFNYAYLGSKVVAGTFETKLLALKDEAGSTLSSVLESLQFDPEKLNEDAIPSASILGYLEMHTEQGCILANADVPVGIVSSIYGQKRIEISFSGKEGHAGTVPMEERHDALAAAAKFIVSVEKYAKREKRNIVATIGKLEIQDSATNKIPGSVTCILDIRSDDSALLSEAYEAINEISEKICGKRNLYFEWKLIQETDPVICSKKLRRLLATSITEKNMEVVSFDSGAVYDAAALAPVAPVAMLLIRSSKGNADIDEQQTQKNDIAAALKVSEHFFRQLISGSEKTFRKKEK